ncbi:hypothetical protein BaRGS_00008322, partial [Batillaria attramentaria]
GDVLETNLTSTRETRRTLPARDSCSYGDNSGLDNDLHLVGEPLEMTFDCLRDRHEAMCGIVDSCQSCYCHSLPTLFARAVNKKEPTSLTMISEPEEAETDTESRLSFESRVLFSRLVGYPVSRTEGTPSAPDVCPGSSGTELHSRSQVSGHSDEATPDLTTRVEAWAEDPRDKLPDVDERTASGGLRGRVVAMTGWLKRNRRKLVFVGLVVLQLVNVCRVGLQIHFSAPDGPLGATTVATFSYLLGWLEVLVVHVATYPRVKNNLPELRSLFRSYESTYGFSFDVKLLNKQRKIVNVIIMAALLVTNPTMFVPLIILVPDFKTQLYPLHDSEGVIFAVGCVIYCLLHLLSALVMTASWQPMENISKIARKEFMHIAELARRAFPSRRHSRRGSSRNGQAEYGGNSSTAASPRAGSSRTGLSRAGSSRTKSVETHCQVEISSHPCLSSDRELETSMFKEGPAMLRDKETLCFRCKRTPPTMKQNDKRMNLEHSEPMEVQQVPDKSADNLNAHECDPAPSTRECERINAHSSSYDTRLCHNVSCVPAKSIPGNSTLPTLGITYNRQEYKPQLSSIRKGDLGLQDDLDPKADAWETTFDLLCDRHEAMCEIVDCCQRCFYHTIPAVYFFGITTFCFIVYAYAGSSLNGAYLALTSLALAKAILAPIYSADWSKFSPALLQKVQFLSTRLTTAEVGFHVYGLFVVNRPTILMIAGTLLTYAVVVVQFQMGVCSCPECANATDIAG